MYASFWVKLLKLLKSGEQGASPTKKLCFGNELIYRVKLINLKNNCEK